MECKVSNYISQFFVDNNIDTTFTVTGGGAMHLNDAFGHQKGMKCIYNHHEQGSAIAAEGYARTSGKIAVCCVTSGPGGTNAITGVMGGWLDSIPMFVISGQVKRETTIWSCPEIGLRQLGDQEFNIIDSVKNMTKYAVMVTDENEIAYHLEKAFYLCNHGRKGPVWLDIPLDVQGAKIETKSLKHFSPDEYSEEPAPVKSETAKLVLEKIKNAKSPLIIAGNGIKFSGAKDEFLKLVEKLQIPVAVEWSGNDILAYDSEYYAGMPSSVGTRGGNFTVQNSDLILSIGCRLNIRMIGYTKHEFAKNAYKIIVDIDEKELKKPTIIPDMPICADAKDFINALLNAEYSPNEEHKKWVQWTKYINNKYPVVMPEYHNNSKLNPYVFMDKLFDCLNSCDVVACGNGSACVITFQAAKMKQGQKIFTNSGCAAMGYGLPAAVGAAVANGGKRVVCIDGDGSIMMNIQELQTIAYNKLNVKIFVINNNGYHSIRQTQTNLFKPPLVGVSDGNGVSFPDFCDIAKAFNIGYCFIDTEKDCEKISEFLDSNGPAICEIFVDENQKFEPKLSSKVLPDGKIVSAPYDDMSPFIDAEEYKNNKYTRWLKTNEC